MLSLKFIWKCNGTTVAKRSWKKKKKRTNLKFERLTFPNFKTISKGSNQSHAVPAKG